MARPRRSETSPPRRPRPAIALRRVIARGYSRADFMADLLAGAVVGVVALPLSMALAIATGVPPQHGLYTAIVAGAVIAALGGSRVQVSGPTAAFVAVLVPVVARFGLGGLLLATVMAGGLLILFGFLHLGRFIELVPYPVTTGFTAGIAIVIATLQLKDFLGLTVAKAPEHFLDRAHELVLALPTARWPEIAVGLLTLVVLLLWPRVSHRIPAPLVALALAGLGAFLAERWLPGFAVDTIRERFSFELDGRLVQGIPSLPPLPVLPWRLPGPDGAALELSLDLLRQLAPAALAIAVLGAIESLLSAVVADGMIRGKHDPDEELVAQGVGNVVAPFFGGFAATGAIARTATNVRSGARSPIAAIVHALVVLASVLLLAPVLGYLPMSALAALLLLMAWRMSEAKHVFHVIRIAPRSDVVVLLNCIGLTVLFDMVVSVTAGIVLASLLFMKRMAEVSGVQVVNEDRPWMEKEPLPPEVVLFEVGGPLFFGAASKAVSALQRVNAEVRCVLLDLRAAPVLDATGLVSLRSAIERLRERKVFVVLAGLQEQPFRSLVRAGFRNHAGDVLLRRSFEKGVHEARAFAARAAG